MSPMMKDAPTPVTRELTTMRNRIRRFLEEPFGLDFPLTPATDRRLGAIAWAPAVEASETDAEYVLNVELPGISRENVEVAMADGVLTLKGHKDEERRSDDRTYHLYEREYGSFERTFRFPMEVAEEKVTAEFANGLLTVKVPKLQPRKAVSRTVPIATK